TSASTSKAPTSPTTTGTEFDCVVVSPGAGAPGPTTTRAIAAVFIAVPSASGAGAPSFNGHCARSLHRSDSPRGSLRDQVFVQARALPLGAIAAVPRGGHCLGKVLGPTASNASGVISVTPWLRALGASSLGGRLLC